MFTKLRACVVLIGIGCGLLGQPAESQLSFDAAILKSVDPRAPGRPLAQGGPGTTDPGRVQYRQVLRRLMMIAYGVRGDQIVGPDWISTDAFEILATVPREATREQVNVMLQNLLAERFGIVSHREMRDSPVYILTVAKGGSKLENSAYPDAKPEGDDSTPFTVDSKGFPILKEGMAVQARASWIKGGVVRSAFRAYSMPLFEEALEQALPPFEANTPGFGPIPARVFEKTGLSGTYDFTLEYAGQGDDSFGPPIVSAVEKQLGLKLEKTKAPLDTIVIDKINKTPEGN